MVEAAVPSKITGLFPIPARSFPHQPPTMSSIQAHASNLFFNFTFSLLLFMSGLSAVSCSLAGKNLEEKETLLQHSLVNTSQDTRPASKLRFVRAPVCHGVMRLIAVCQIKIPCGWRNGGWLTRRLCLICLTFSQFPRGTFLLSHLPTTFDFLLGLSASNSFSFFASSF